MYFLFICYSLVYCNIRGLVVVTFKFFCEFGVYSTQSWVYTKLLTGINVAVTMLLLLLVSCQHSPFSLLSKPCSSNAFFNTSDENK